MTELCEICGKPVDESRPEEDTSVCQGHYAHEWDAVEDKGAARMRWQDNINSIINESRGMR